ncbi:hypothetical protein HYT33_03515 [Candidatus Roizmanbacteria bacterium]|nr:hypothetical protein [Candidatus Roizmanbacteria bacterium]
MKKPKKQKSSAITKAYLDKRLGLSEQILKDSFKNYTDQRFDRFEKYLDYRLKPLEQMAKDFYEFKDSVSRSLDWLVGKYKKFDDEHVVLSAGYSTINDHLDNHEERLKTLEKKH